MFLKMLRMLPHYIMDHLLFMFQMISLISAMMILSVMIPIGCVVELNVQMVPLINAVLMSDLPF